jgi:hypothetical protein
MQILKIPDARYTDEDIKKSMENAEALEQLESQWPDIQKQYAELGLLTEKAQDKMDHLRKRRASAAEIQKAAKEHQQAIWQQDRAPHDHSQTIAALQNSQQKLSRNLRFDAHLRWLDENKGLVLLPRIETVKEYHDVFTGAKTEDILTNGPAIAEAQKRLMTAIQQLSALQNADIPTIVEFIESFESELAKLDLSKLTRWDAIPQSRVNDMKEIPIAAGPLDKATIMQNGSIHIHPRPMEPAVKMLADRITKLEKGKTE